MKKLIEKVNSPFFIIFIVLLAIATGGYYFFGHTNLKEMRDESSKLNKVPTGQNSGTPQASAHANIDIFDFSFTPYIITIKVGQRVAWANKDSVPHTVTSDLGLFDSGNLPVDVGNSYSRIFNQVGTFTYHCSYHPNMKGTIIVTE